MVLAKHLAALAERGVAGARQLEQAGEGLLTDVLLLDTENQRAQIRLRNTQTTLEGELKQLAAIVGSPGLVIKDVEGTLFEVPPQFDEQDVLRFLQTDSSYAERARAEITRKQAQLRRAEVEPYPDLQVGPHYVAGTLPDASQYWFTVEFQIPVWNLNQGNIRKGSAEVHKSIAEREVQQNELNKEVSELFAEHRAARKGGGHSRADFAERSADASLGDRRVSQTPIHRESVAQEPAELGRRIERLL
ncbi:MAG: TolC family protein [Pirellulales bacterium]